jgi:ribosomal protein S12 methylthiotransferase
VGVVSLGCSKNLVDTEFMLGRLVDDGWEVTPDHHRADLLIVNTCAFVAPAVRESEETIARLLRGKARRPGTRVVVAGCLVNRSAPDLVSRFPAVDVFLPPDRIGELGLLLDGTPQGCAVAAGGRGFLPGRDARRLLTTAPWAFLKISDGCDNRCAYCLIPAIRGPHRSRGLSGILDEAAGLISSGVRELNLVGQDLTRWRSGRKVLEDLLGALDRLPGDFRIRLLYLHPSRVTASLAAAMAEHPKVLPYLDMPIQHADDRVLEAMGRPYRGKDLRRIYRLLRETVPGIALRTTVMVGHPGEGRREFQVLGDFLEECPFENLGCFAYSPQAGTPSADREAVSPGTAARRRRKVMLRQEEISASLWSGRVGRTVEALILSPLRGRSLWLGRAAWQAPEVDGSCLVRGRCRPGEWSAVTVTGARTYDLEARASSTTNPTTRS